MTIPAPFTSSSRSACKRQYRAWSVRTIVVQLSRKLKATYRIRGERCLSHLLATLLAGMSPWALADLPTGLNVVAGQATASMPTANSMRINQATDKAVLNWQTFNIGVGQSVQFVQPAATSVALNRIVGNEASSIYGSLSANGQVFLVNPSGVMFAPGAQVNVGGLVASSLAIGNEDFMAGRYTFSGLGGGAVDNHGTLSAAGRGYVLLAAPKVTNTGSINAEAGSIGLVAGSRVTLDTSGMGLVRFSVDAAAANAAITSSGSIIAGGGQVAVLASAVGDALATVINQTGVIRADSAVERNGMIVLSGGQTGVVKVAGTLSATGAATGQAGGTVQVLGDKVLLAMGARIDASGQSGGGTVLVGGDYQGSNAGVQNASRVHVAANTNLNADATSSGNGGKVVVWADGDTRFAGSISARGGAQGGNGGFVEVSGKRDLDMQGRIDVAAPKGTGGKVLLDPQDIVLNATTQTSPPNNANATPDVAFADAPAAGTYTIQVADITGYSELFLQATNNITINSAVAMGAGNSIRLEANNNIAVNANIRVTGAGSINLRADADSSGAGNLTLTNAALSAQAGGITLRGANVTGTGAGSTIAATGAANGNAGNISITADTGNVSLVAALTANGGTTTSVGRDAGSVNITAQTGIATAAITASGTAGAAGNNNGGAAGSITVVNNSTTAGAIALGALTARTGAAQGTGLGGTAGTISVTNNAAATALSTLAIDTSGNAGGNGGNVTLASQGSATVTGTFNTSGLVLAAGTRAGSNAGNVTITGTNNSVTGAITANGSAANGTDQTGGNAGVVSITGAGTLNISTINARAGGATGTGAGGNAGSITLTGSNAVVGALSTAGNANGAGGAISLTSTGTLSVGTIATGGGAATGMAGRNAGAITLSAAGITAVGNITASGGTGGAGLAGGTGSTVNISSIGGIAIAAANTITASGGSGGTTNGVGGNAGAITVTNSAAGNVVTGALTASSGNSIGAALTGGNAGSISVTNNFATGNVTTAALATTGGAGGNGGSITLSSQAGVTATTLNTNGTALASGTRTGSNAGNVTISGVNRSITGAINASGSAANGINQVGGAAGTVSITGAGTLGTSTINARTGAATGTGTGGAVGSITLKGSSATIGALSTAGNANGNGGAVTITTTGTLALAGANASNGAGGIVRGDVTLLAGGAITQSGAIVTRNLSATTASAGGSAITLSNTANDAITVNLQVKDGTTAAPGTSNVNAAISYTDVNAVAVSGINSGTGGTAGDVTLLAGGALTQTGAIKATTLTATTANTNAITLTNTGNDASTVNLQARTGTVAAPGTVNANVAVQYTDASGFIVSGINNGASGTAGALTLVASGSITQTGAVNASTLNAALTGSTSALNLGTQANKIAQLNAITTPGGFTLTNGNNNVVVNGNIMATNSAVSIDTGTGSYSQNNFDISAGTGPITVIANTVAIGANTGGNALTASGTLTLKPKSSGQAMSLAGASAFDLSAAEITAISTGATGPIVIGDTTSTGVMTIGGAVNLTGKTLTLNAGSITDAGTKTITAQNVTLKANGQIGTSNADGIDIAATNLSVNTTGNANAFVRTGVINIGVGTGGSSVGGGTLDLTATGAVTQTAGTGNITAGTLNVKTLANAGAAITLTNSANDAAVVNLKTRNLADTSNAAGVIQYADATGFDVAAIVTTGNATLSAGGVVTQSGAIAAAGLALKGMGGAYTLNNAGNAVTTLAATTGSIDYKQSGALSVGTVGVAGVTTTGTTRIETTGTASNLTLNNAVTSGATGDAVVLKAGSANAAGVSTGGQLINNVGTGGIVAGSGRYLAYSGDPTTTTEGVAGYAKRYNADASFVPAGAASTFVYRIAPSLAVTANAGNKVYDAASPTLTFGTTGLIDGDTVSTALTGALTRAGGKNVLGGDAVTIGTLATQLGYGITYTGANYSITAKALSASASASNKVYDGNTTAAATLAIAPAGFVGTETVTAAGAATFNTKDVATANLVTVNSTALGDGTNGGLASNYSLAAGQTVAANITRANIANVSGITAANKIQDGTTAATLFTGNAVFTGKVAGDAITVATASGTFDTPAVGTGKVVNISGIRLGGTDAGNYNLVSTTASTTANILRLGSGSGAGSFPEGALAVATNTALVTANAQREREQRCAVASRDGGDSADTASRRLSSDLVCD